MKNSKKIILLSVLGLVLGACGSVTDSSEKDGAVNSSSRESISIKDLAIEPEYGQMYHEELDVGTHIHIVGELGEIPEAPEHATFLMAALSKDGTGISFYNIENYTPNNSEFKFSKNDMVDVWGIYQGNDEEKGTPIIRAFVIETNHTAKRVSEAINEIVNKTDDDSIEAPSGNYTKTETYNDAINITSREQEILDILNSSFYQFGFFEFDVSSKTYSLYLHDEALIHDINLMADGQLDTNFWTENMTSNFISLSKQNMGYTYDVRNPMNIDNTLLMVRDGDVYYDFVDDLN